MYTKLLAAILAALIINVVCLSPVKGQGGAADEVRAKVSKLGTGPKAVVRVTLLDKTKVQGWVSMVTDDHFTVTAEKSGATTTIPYADVKGVKSLKPSRGTLIAGGFLVFGIAAAVFFFAGSKN